MDINIKKIVFDLIIYIIIIKCDLVRGEERGKSV